MIPMLSLFALLTATVHIWADYHGPRWLVYIAKPATTTLILLVAVLARQPVSMAYQWLIVVGLLFALAGDIFLMLPADRFLAGLVSFLLAHLWYIGAFGAALLGWSLSWWGLAVVLFAAGVYLVLQPDLGALQWPVLFYMAAISFMAWLAITLFVQRGEAWALSAAAGAGLFVISDATLAINRFRKPFRSAPLLVLGSYYLAQWLIALSVYAQ
jgi:uncharacterized membrane protein YhhN